MSDLISRKDLIDWLTSRIIMLKGIYGDLGGAVSGVREMVKVMPSAEPERRWIPVTEKLPEEEMDVLVSVHFDGYKSEYTYYPPSDYVEIASQIDGVWSSLSDEYKVVEVNHHVVAWMPLPESYKGD